MLIFIRSKCKLCNML